MLNIKRGNKMISEIPVEKPKILMCHVCENPIISLDGQVKGVIWNNIYMYFCSDECAEKFLEDLDLFLSER